MAPHSSTLAWKIPWTEEPGRLQSMGLLRVQHDWATSLSLFTFMHRRRKWQPTPVFLPRDGGAWWAAIYGVAHSRTRLKWLSSSSSIVLCAVQKQAGFLTTRPPGILCQWRVCHSCSIGCRWWGAVCWPFRLYNWMFRWMAWIRPLWCYWLGTVGAMRFLFTDEMQSHEGTWEDTAVSAKIRSWTWVTAIFPVVQLSWLQGLG